MDASAPLLHDIRRFRLCMTTIIAGLVLSGITAFPLLAELELLARGLGPPDPHGTGAVHGLQTWVTRVRDGLRTTYAAHPWIAYGTDWLAFGHLVIALFFVGPLLHPTRDHRGNLASGIAACIAVVPLACIAGQVRGIPWGWRMIDCAFGIVGIVPLLIAWRIHHRLRAARL